MIKQYFYQNDEYEKLCGVRQGSSGNPDSHFAGGVTHGGSRRQNAVLTQEDIAKELGVDVRTIQRLKKLQTLSPELQQIQLNRGIRKR